MVPCIINSIDICALVSDGNGFPDSCTSTLVDLATTLPPVVTLSDFIS